MKRASLLALIVVAVTLAACEGQRITQCDPTNTPGSNCYRQPRPFLNP
jgi:hypothetical protein